MGLQVFSTQENTPRFHEVANLSGIAAHWLPGNQLEKLKGDRQGQYSVRVNQKWRICFVWKDGEAHDVEFVDYH